MTNIRNLARKPSDSQGDRLPVETYDQALGRLALIALNPDVSTVEMDNFVQFVADLFWVKDTRVQADLIKRLREVTL